MFKNIRSISHPRLSWIRGKACEGFRETERALSNLVGHFRQPCAYAGCLSPPLEYLRFTTNVEVTKCNVIVFPYLFVTVERI